jgi:hypothetical protein
MGNDLVAIHLTSRKQLHWLAIRMILRHYLFTCFRTWIIIHSLILFRTALPFSSGMEIKLLVVDCFVWNASITHVQNSFGIIWKTSTGRNVGNGYVLVLNAVRFHIVGVGMCHLACLTNIDWVCLNVQSPMLRTLRITMENMWISLLFFYSWFFFRGLHSQ